MGVRKKPVLRVREASDLNREMALGITDPEKRRSFIEHLRKKEWVVFTPRGIDYERLNALAANDDELRYYLEHETDPVLISTFLAHNYGQIFLGIDHVYRVYTEWNIRRMKVSGYHAGNREELRIPDHLLEAMKDDELEMIARRWLRKEIRQLNQHPKIVLKDVARKLRIERNPKQRRLLEHLRRLIQGLMSERYPAFIDEINANPFPSFHVRLWVREIEKRKSALIVGDVGTHKTSAAVIGLECLGCKATVVICRSYAKEMWQTEIQKYFREPMDPLVFDGASDLERLERMKPADLRRHRFIIVGYGAIQSGHEDEEEDDTNGERLVELLSRLRPDSIVIDEAHIIKGSSERSNRIRRLAQSASIRHRLMLSATPFENHPNEVALMATLLDPKTFPTEEVFYAMCRDNPRMFFGLMSQRMCDYFAQEDVLDLPPTNLTLNQFFPTVRLKCPADMRRVHTALQEDGSREARQQASRMMQFLSVPYVARNWYQGLESSECFHDPLANPKLAYLREEIAKLIKKGKVVVASGIFASGITRRVNGAEHELSIYEVASILESWFPGQVLRIDGTNPTGDGSGSRKDIQNRWRTDVNAKILVASVQATSESLDFTLKRIPGKQEKVTIFYLTLPWKPTQYLQFNGRFRRPGMEIPIDVLSLIIEGTADEALLELNERKWRNFLIGVHGMPILADEEAALENATFRQLVMTPTKWLRAAFERMLGLGEAGIRELQHGDLKGLPVAETLASYYLKSEDQGTPGHVARLIVPVLKRWHETGLIGDWENVLDVGPGPLVLERKLNAPLHAIEINPQMIEIGKAHSFHAGRNAIEGAASQMPKEWAGRFSLVIASLLLDLTSRKVRKNGGIAERVKVFQEFHRVLERDGLLWAIVQERCFDRESFNGFVTDMRQYGFEPVEPWCNRIEAIDHRQHRFAVWSLLLRKRSEIRAAMPPCPLFFHELAREGVVASKKKRLPMETGSLPEVVLHEQFAIRDEADRLLPVETIVDAVTAPGVEADRLFHELIKNFHVLDPAMSALRQELMRTRPNSLTELKEVWNKIRDLAGAPRISWGELTRIARPYLRQAS